MKKRGRIELVWEGDATVEAARKAMKRGDAIEIGLPLGVHHALFRHLHPESAPGLPEDLDELAGPELLRKISAVAGLEEFADLEKAVKAARYRVQLLTPDPLVVLLPPAR